MNDENKHLIDRIVKGDKIEFLNGEIGAPWYTRDFETTYSQIKEGCERALNSFTK